MPITIPKTLEINQEFKAALFAMEETGEHVFLTGNAGTGKSTLLDHFRKKTKKRVAILAPTGVAAINVKGQTIHSFFGFKPNTTRASVRKASKDKRSLYDNLDTIIIDEISMVRSDLLDCVDKSLRLNRNAPDTPFGGVQMIFIGDLFQLPPVVTQQEKFMFENEYASPFFFSSYVFGEIQLTYVELQNIYRQEDERFIRLLNNIRHDKVTQEDMDLLARRHDENYVPDTDDLFVYLTTTNKKAEYVNAEALKRISAQDWVFQGTMEGEFGERRLPAPRQLELRNGAQVMMVNNDPQKRWANGTIGSVIGVEKGQTDQEPDAIRVALQNGRVVSVQPNTWEMFEYVFNEETGQLEGRVTGKYKQYPLTLAWAVTIHKSQGKTFDNVVIDVGWGTFVHGQMYVALSRCTSLDGLVLKRPFKTKDILLDGRVAEFIKQFV